MCGRSGIEDRGRQVFVRRSSKASRVSSVFDRFPWNLTEYPQDAARTLLDIVSITADGGGLEGSSLEKSRLRTVSFDHAGLP